MLLLQDKQFSVRYALLNLIPLLQNLMEYC